MIVYNMAVKVLDTVIYSAQHRWPDLWHYIYCFVQSGEAFTVERNTHTHTGNQEKLPVGANLYLISLYIIFSWST